ncbi:MAG: hypothetical protein K0Q49_1073 [Haloplasmataceae bacterium]|jgi:hypothetical protein|nr:hypothetical protein [Haloplasmataceae bacterium]
MGYLILGIIILLLLTVFMTDLYRSYRDNDDESYNVYRGQPYHSEFGEDLDVNDDLDDVINDDNDNDVDMIWTNMGVNNTIFPNQINPNTTEFSDDLGEDRFDVLDDEIIDEDANDEDIEEELKK